MVIHAALQEMSFFVEKRTESLKDEAKKTVLKTDSRTSLYLWHRMDFRICNGMNLLFSSYGKRKALICTEKFRNSFFLFYVLLAEMVWGQ